jgi:hypothetical protein
VDLVTTRLEEAGEWHAGRVAYQLDISYRSVTGGVGWGRTGRYDGTGESVRLALDVML